MTRKELGKKAGIINFRELGGYQTDDGKSVRTGAIYRGQHLSALSDKGKQFVDDLGLGTILDFRSESEAEKEPNYVPAGAEYIRIPGIASMDENMAQYNKGGNLNMQDLILQAKGDAEGIALLRGYLKESYREMALRPDAFAALMRLLLEKPDKPLLFHCTAGKDRTGVGAALILSVLGVPRQTVLDDYLLSNRFRRAEVRRTMWKMRIFVRDRQLADVVEQMLTVRPELIGATFSAIDEQYGGFEAFVAKGLLLTREDVKTLKARYLE